MQVNFCNVRYPPYFSQAYFHTTNCQPPIRRFEGDKERRIIIIPTVDVLLEMDFSSGIKVRLTFLVPFAKYHALPLLKVYILSVHFYQFTCESLRRQCIEQVRFERISPNLGSEVHVVFQCGIECRDFVDGDLCVGNLFGEEVIRDMLEQPFQ